ncbi:MAG: hypothetical protein QXP01_00350, partial [Candidatus Hadarchaeum sp.]
MMVVYGLANAVTAAAVGLVWYQNRRHFSGLSLWLVNFVLQTGTIVLFILRGYIPDLLSMTVSNTMAMGGIIALYIGLERFTGRESSQTHNYALLAVFGAVSAYFTVIHPNLAVRNILVTIMTLVLTGQVAWLLLYRVGPDLRPLTAITGAVIAAYAAVTLARLVLSIIFPTTSGDFF